MLINQEPNSFQLGLDGFIWFMGVVESVDDPLSVGRAKVRIFAWHDDSLPTNDLPWAFPLRPITHSRTPSNVRPGDWVWGFFLDGKIGQQPMMLATFPAIAQPLSVAEST
jgi:hypothetical protein